MQKLQERIKKDGKEEKVKNAEQIGEPSQDTLPGCKYKDYEITLIGHSLGTVALDELIQKHPDLCYENIVYMGAASSIRSFRDKVVPYLEQNGEANFYNLSLHPSSKIAIGKPATMLP